MSQAAVEVPSEGDLVDQARHGDRIAFEELVRRHQHEVFTLASRLVSSRDHASDVAQEAFIRAWRGIGRFRGDAAFSTWLHRITVNAALTHRKRASRHPGMPLEDATPIADGALESDPERAGENVELRDRLKRALDRLPHHQRTVVVLKDVYGWSHNEIAEALAITVTAAKVRLHRAHRRLRDLLHTEAP
jgi:RNA polymerase sigma-70 factor (ECF subfamily)